MGRREECKRNAVVIAGREEEEGGAGARLGDRVDKVV